LLGILTLSDLQRAYDSGQAATALDICTPAPICAFTHEPLWSAIRRMSSHDIGRLPVIDPKTQQVVGMIGRHGVVRAYNIAYSRKLRNQHAAETARLNTLTGGHAVELHVTPDSAVHHRRIREVVWPGEAVIAAIWREDKLIMPHGSTELRAGDRLTIVVNPRDELALRALVEPASSAPLA
jgi:hypothetical protein